MPAPAWQDTLSAILADILQLAAAEPDLQCAFRGENTVVPGWSQSALWRHETLAEADLATAWACQADRIREAASSRGDVTDRDMIRALDGLKTVPKADAKGQPVPWEFEPRVVRLLLDLHYSAGASTLLLDLTLDLNVALFFACMPAVDRADDSAPLPDAIVKCFVASPERLWLPGPLLYRQHLRIAAQKCAAILPSSRRGVRDTLRWIVPGAHRQPILRHLAGAHGLDSPSVFMGWPTMPPAAAEEWPPAPDPLPAPARRQIPTGGYRAAAAGPFST